MEKEKDPEYIPEEPTLVLPVICHNCGTELNLSMEFALLAPKEEIINTKQDDNIEITEA